MGAHHIADAALDGEDAALLEYSTKLEDELESCLEQRAHYYRRVTRWPNSRFWRRRQRLWPSELPVVLPPDAPSRGCTKPAKDMHRFRIPMHAGLCAAD